MPQKPLDLELMYMKEIREQFFDNNEINDQKYHDNMNENKQAKVKSKPEISDKD